jgi:hypothetical protein
MSVIDKHFALKRWGTKEDDDTGSTFRAYIHHQALSPAGNMTRWITFFPPTQYISTADEHAFALALEEELRTLDWSKVTTLRGDVLFPKLTKINND